MKNSIIILSALVMILSSFITIRHSELGDAAAERMAQSVVTALQHNSIEEYAALYPTLAELHEIMEKNAEYYGENLAAAKIDFELQYNSFVVPSLNQSFNSIIAIGKKAGVDWGSIQLTSIDLVQDVTNSSPTITFVSNHKEYHLSFDRALFINGEWKVTQYVNLY